MKKKCNDCGKRKLLTEFVKNRAKFDGLQGNCAACGRERNKRWYRKNRLYKKQKTKSYAKERRALFGQRLCNIKQKLGCQLCDESDTAALEFHHVEKSGFEVYTLVSECRSWDRITKELSFCVCLCANCHNKTHKHNWSVDHLPRCSTVVVV